MVTQAFQQELAYLRQAGQAFSSAHPTLAYYLGRPGSDPDIERLLEGFAFLTARVQQQTQQCAPKLVEELAALMLPSLGRPIPASTIVQVTFDPNNFRGDVRLPAGSEVRATLSSSGAVCRFQTIACCPATAISITDTQLMQKRSDIHVLRLSCCTPRQTAAGLSKLRFFVAAPFPVASTLVMALAEHTVQVSVYNGKRSVNLEPGAVQLPFEASELALLEDPMEPSTGHRLLSEYMILPEKFLFFDVEKLDAANFLMYGDFTIEITLKNLPPLAAPLPPNAIRLNCVPACNIFAATAIPLQRYSTGHKQLLRADGMPSEHTQVIDVQRVTGLTPGAAERAVYPSFASYLHAVNPQRSGYYKLGRERCVVDGAANAYLEIHNPENTAPYSGQEILSVNLTCSNRLLAAQLGTGDVSQLHNTSIASSAINVTPVSAPIQPPMGDDLVWRFLAQLTHGHAEVSTAEALRSQLSLFASRLCLSSASKAAQAHRLGAIQAVSQIATPELLQGIPQLTRRTTLTLEDKGFASAGDAYIYGRILRTLFESETSIQTPEGVSIKLQPSGYHFDWPVRSFL